MEKNYYELLEVSKNASPEVIEKVYKMFAKKYHPDLQPPEKKEESAEMFKKISAAYEVLSDEKLRAEYDQKLALEEQASTVSIEEYQKLEDDYNALADEFENLKSSQNYGYTSTNQNYNPNYSSQNNYQQPPQSNYQPNNYANNQQNTQQYQNYQTVPQYNNTNYYQPTPQNNGRTTSPKRHFYFLGIKIPNREDILSFFVTILVIVIAIVIIAMIPATRNYFINLYNEIPLLKPLVDCTIKVFTGIFNGIKNLFV